MTIVNIGLSSSLTYLVIIMILPTVKNIQNFRALNTRRGIYNVEIRKHEKPQPRHTTKQISLVVVESLNAEDLFQKLGPPVVTLSSTSDLKEYCELNILFVMDTFRSISG